MHAALTGAVASRSRGQTLEGTGALVPIALSDSPNSFGGTGIFNLDVGVAAVQSAFVGSIFTVPAVIDQGVNGFVGSSIANVPIGVANTDTLPPPPPPGPDFIVYAQIQDSNFPLPVPAHQAGDLLFAFINASSFAETPATLPGWESVCIGGNGSNQARWRLMRRIDTDNTVTEIPIGADDSRPQWVIVTRRAAFVQGATVPGEFSGDGTVGTGATVPPVSITSSGNKILSGVYAQNGNVDWVGAENMIPIAVSEGTAAWGVWISPAQTEATWPGYTVNWFFSNGSPSNQFYTRWYVELAGTS